VFNLARGRQRIVRGPAQTFDLAWVVAASTPVFGGNAQVAVIPDAVADGSMRPNSHARGTEAFSWGVEQRTERWKR
jgi:hypothetical protein